MHIGQMLFELFWPKQCYRCSGNEHWWCYPPQSRPDWPLCFGCRKNYHPETKLGTCRQSLPLIRIGEYSDPLLREAIHAWKYNGYWAISTSWAEMLAMSLTQLPVPGSRLFLPIPLHPSRERSRGFNQSQVLAKQLARLTQGNVCSPLRRVRSTDSQTNLTPEERYTNILKAFQVTTTGRNQPIWIVDDVVTTGSTCQEAIKVLRGSHWQIAGVIAIAQSADSSRSTNIVELR